VVHEETLTIFTLELFDQYSTLHLTNVIDRL